MPRDLVEDGSPRLAGQKWLQQFREAISSADVVIFFLWKASRFSQGVQYECEKAFELQTEPQGTRLIHVRLDKADLPPQLREIQDADFTECYFDGMQQLL